MLWVWDGDRGSQEEMDGPKCHQHNEVIPPSRASSIPRLQHGVPTATACWGHSPGVCGCHGDKGGLIKTQ